MHWLFRFGIRLNTDSAHYLEYANIIHFGREFVHRADWPPLFALLIAAAQHIVPTAADAAAIVIGVAGALLILASYWTGRNLAGNRWATLGLAATVTLPAIVDYALVAVAEIQTAAFIVAGVGCFTLHDRTEQRRWWVAASAFAAAAALSRYPAYALPAALVLDSVRRRTWADLAVVAAACLPSAAWVARNWISTGTLHGPTTDPGFRIVDDLTASLRTWYADLGIWLTCGFLVAVLVLSKQADRRSRTAGFLLLVLGLYIGLVLYGTSADTVMPIHARYFVPIYPLVPLTIVAAGRGVRKSRISAGLAFALALGAIGHAPEAWRRVESIRDREGEHAWHQDAGFNRTVTARKLREALTTDEDLHICLLYDWSTGGVSVHRQRVGRLLFDRSRALPERICDHVCCSAHDFTLLLESGRRIHYHEIDDADGAEQLASEIARLPIGTQVWVMGPLRNALVVDNQWSRLLPPLDRVLRPAGMVDWSYWKYVTKAPSP